LSSPHQRRNRPESHPSHRSHVRRISI